MDQISAPIARNRCASHVTTCALECSDGQCGRESQARATPARSSSTVTAAGNVPGLFCLSPRTTARRTLRQYLVNSDLKDSRDLVPTRGASLSVLPNGIQTARRPFDVPVCHSNAARPGRRPCSNIDLLRPALKAILRNARAVSGISQT